MSNEATTSNPSALNSTTNTILTATTTLTVSGTAATTTTTTATTNATNNSEPPKKPETSTEKTFSRLRSLASTEYGFKLTTNENYLQRLQNLRKELDYINETAWMYEPVDKKPQV